MKLIVDGDDYPADQLVQCANCGQEFHLWWNGGELDKHTCACGFIYEGVHAKAIVRVTAPRQGERVVSLSDEDVERALEAINQRFGPIDEDADLTVYSRYSDIHLGTVRELVTLVLIATSESRADTDVERIAAAVERKIAARAATMRFVPSPYTPVPIPYWHTGSPFIVTASTRTTPHEDEGSWLLNPGTAGDD